MIGQFSDNRCISQRDAARVSYSEQQVISCDRNEFGCNGGYLAMSQLFLQTTGTLPATCVSYKSGKTGQTGVCPVKCDDSSPLPMLTRSKTF